MVQDLNIKYLRQQRKVGTQIDLVRLELYLNKLHNLTYLYNFNLCVQGLGKNICISEFSMEK